MASCTEAKQNYPDGIITSDISITYLNLENYPNQKNFLIVNAKYENRSKQALYFYYPMVVVDTLNQRRSEADVNDGFINMGAVKDDSLLDPIIKDVLLKTFEDTNQDRNKLFETNFKKENKNQQQFRKRMFERLVFLNPGEQIVKSYFFKDVFSRKDNLHKTDTLIFRTVNVVKTDKNYSKVEGDFISILPEKFDGFTFYNHKIVSDSLTIVRKGFDPIKFEDILRNDIISQE